MGGSLRVVEGPDSGVRIDVEGDVVLGRAAGGAGHLNDASVSGRHARIHRGGDGSLVLEDLGSRNGTWRNGRRVGAPETLRPGDHIRVGRTTLRVETVPDASPPPPESPPPPDAAPRSPESPPPPDAAHPPPEGPPTVAGAVPPRGSDTGAPPPQHLQVPDPPHLQAPDPPQLRTPGPPPLFPPGLPPLPGSPPPPARTDKTGARTKKRRATKTAAAAVVVAAFAAGFGLGWSRRGGSTTVAAGAGGPVAGTLYLESNATQPGANAVLAYHFGPGADLQPVRLTEYPTGGSGSADLTDSGVLDATGQVVVDDQRHLLFAVNQGSDTVAVFRIAGDGDLSPVPGSPFPSGGAAPVSVGVAGDLIVVANKAQDGIRSLVDVPATYATFRIAANGSLTPTGHVVTVGADSSPTQALIASGGKLVFGSEESGPIRAFRLAPDGTLTPGPDSGLTPPDDLFPATLRRGNTRFGLGLAANPHRDILYLQLPNAGKLGVYRYDASGRLTFVTAVPHDGGLEPCWTEVNAAGTRLYTDNAANNSMSVFDITSPLAPRQLQVLTLSANGNPWDLGFDPSGTHIFMIDTRDRQVNVAPGQGNEIHTLTIEPDGTLAELAPPVPVPVPLGTNPFGIAVAPER